jgi:hypothetical protein
MVEQLNYFGTAFTFKIPFMRKLRAEYSQGIIATIQCRIFCLPVYYPKYKDKDTQNCNFACCFVWVFEFVTHIEGGM